MNPAHKRLLFAGIAVIVILTLLELAAYDVIKIDWVSFMEIQESFKPMEHPLPVAARSIPIEGAAYIAGQGAPANPVPADAASVERGRILYSVTCIQCHGPNADGNGIVGLALVNKPADLTSLVTQSKLDGALFLTITNGIQGTGGQIHMPALNENLTVRDRWDVVNYLRTLKATATPTVTPTPTPTPTPKP
ncbi:MAG: c-type cytochrome [Anaerolineales bacterium]